MLDALLALIASLETFPLRGAIPKELEAFGLKRYRQVVLPPYRVLYRVVAARVFVVLIVDGRRDLPTLFERRALGR